MADPLPTVLFVDEDESALHRILLQIEPIYTVFSLRSPSQVFRYLDRVHPEVIVVSDRIEYRKRSLRELLPKLRERFRGKIIVLSDQASAGDRALWKERGADECLLHPTREQPRLEDLSRRINDLAAEVRLSMSEGDGDARRD